MTVAWYLLWVIAFLAIAWYFWRHPDDRSKPMSRSHQIVLVAISLGVAAFLVVALLGYVTNLS